ncbi:MAG: bacteriocin [Ferruginibacter sp.]
MKYKDFKVMDQKEMKEVVGGKFPPAVSYDCVFSYSDGYTSHHIYSGTSGSAVQCAADADAMAQGPGCTGADCIGSGAC